MQHKLRCYSVVPYASNKVLMALRESGSDTRWLEDVREFVFALKNNRLTKRRRLDAAALFADRLASWDIPELAESGHNAGSQRLVLAPIPTSTGAAPPAWPGLALATRLAGLWHQRDRDVWVARAFERIAPVSKSSDPGGQRPTVQAHLDSIAVDIAEINAEDVVALVDDVLTRGTQGMACAVGLRRAGHQGPIILLTAAETVTPQTAPTATGDTRAISWTPGNSWPTAG